MNLLSIEEAQGHFKIIREEAMAGDA